MDLVVRAIPKGKWIKTEADSVSCTYNRNDASPMAVVMDALGIDRTQLASGLHMNKLLEEDFRVDVHRTAVGILLTTTKTRTWDNAKQATSKITKAADAEGCKSLCMTHFMFIPGKFPAAAFLHCLQMAAFSEHKDHLEKVIVDVDDRYIDLARKMLVKVQEQQAYAKKFSIACNLNLAIAEAGSPDNQGLLAADILIQSNHPDRCVEALKWLIIANHVRKNTDKNNQIARYESVLEFLMFRMEKVMVDKAWALADEWLDKIFDDQTAIENAVPEFRNYIDSWKI